MHEAIEDGISERRFIDIGVPLIDWKLAGDQRRFLVVTILEDLQQVAFGLVRQRRKSKVVDVKQVHLCELLQEGWSIGLRMMPSQFLDQSW